MRAERGRATRHPRRVTARQHRAGVGVSRRYGRARPRHRGRQHGPGCGCVVRSGQSRRTAFRARPQRRSGWTLPALGTVTRSAPLVRPRRNTRRRRRAARLPRLRRCGTRPAPATRSAYDVTPSSVGARVQDSTCGPTRPASRSRARTRASTAWASTVAPATGIQMDQPPTDAQVTGGTVTGGATGRLGRRRRARRIIGITVTAADVGATASVRRAAPRVRSGRATSDGAGTGSRSTRSTGPVTRDRVHRPPARRHRPPLRRGRRHVVDADISGAKVGLDLAGTRHDRRRHGHRGRRSRPGRCGRPDPVTGVDSRHVLGLRIADVATVILTDSHGPARRWAPGARCTSRRHQLPGPATALARGLRAGRAGVRGLPGDDCAGFANAGTTDRVTAPAHVHELRLTRRVPHPNARRIPMRRTTEHHSPRPPVAAALVAARLVLASVRPARRSRALTGALRGLHQHDLPGDHAELHAHVHQGGLPARAAHAGRPRQARPGSSPPTWSCRTAARWTCTAAAGRRRGHAAHPQPAPTTR